MRLRLCFNFGVTGHWATADFFLRGAHNMSLAKVEGATALARWTGRIALFSAVLLLFALVGHRFFGLATPVMLSLVTWAFAGAIFAMVLGVIAAVRIWRQGTPGLARVVTAFLIGLAMLAWPLSYLPELNSLPELNDITTDMVSPPAFKTLANVRKAPANGVAYHADPFAARQKASYPDIAPLMINRSAEETFDLVVDAIRRQRMRIVRETQPSKENGQQGSLEAVDQTLILGFRDDVAIRVTGQDMSSRVDIRSASRYGRHDFGRNAQRVRDVMGEIVKRLESTIPGAAENRRIKSKSKRRTEQ